MTDHGPDEIAALLRASRGEKMPEDSSRFSIRNPVAAEIGAVAGLCLIGLLARAIVYVRIEDVLHADAAIQGIMARHILGGELQLFTYGISHLGTLQAHWIALCFALFGDSTFVLKWAAGTESLLLIPAVYLLAREMAGGDRRAALLAGLLTAAGPLYLVEWSLRARGGNVQVVIFSAFALWLTLRACRIGGTAAAGDPASALRSARRSLALAGFLLGLSWWSQFTTIYAMLACFLAFLWLGGPLRRNPGVWLFGAGAFLAGSLPFWLFNIKYPMTSLSMAGGAGRGAWSLVDTFHRARGAVQVALPVLLGARQTEALQSFGTGAVALAFAGWGALIVAVTAPGREPRPRRAVVVALGFAAIACAFYVLTPYGHYPADPRYLLPLYAVLGPLAAVGFVALWERRALAWKAAAVAGVVVILGVSVNGYRRGERGVIQPFGAGQNIPNDLSLLTAFLDKNGIDRIFTNFYVGYRLCFETGERIMASTEGDPIHELYTPYKTAVIESEQPPAFVVGPDKAMLLSQALELQGIEFDRETIQGFEVFHNLSEPFLQYPPPARPFEPVAIDVGDYSNRCRPGERFPVPLTVRNDSPTTWPAPPARFAVQMSYHLVDPADDRMVRFENPRTPLAPQPVAPGESVEQTIEVRAPNEPGEYAFVPQAMIEGLAWLETTGNTRSGDVGAGEATTGTITSAPTERDAAGDRMYRFTVESGP